MRPTRRSAAGSEGADPDGDGALDRQWGQPGRRDVVEAAVHGHALLRPELAQHAHLLLQEGAPVGERVAERLVLHAVPPDAEPEPECPPGHDVELGRLLGQQGGLALGPDEDRGDEAQLA